MQIVRSSRQLAKEKTQCTICLEDFFDTLDGRERVVPVKMGCQHTFCRECIETHLSSNIKCPLPWCEVQLPLQPDDCHLCAYWEKSHASCLVMAVRPEMASSIKDNLDQLAAESEEFQLSKEEKAKLMSHVRSTLKQYEWQYHSGVDLAELLDPFLLALNENAAREHYGAKLYAPASNPDIFSPRLNDPEDYPTGQEPWIAAFLRQWALQYEKENGEVRAGWGIWEKKIEKDASFDWESWEFPYKRIIAHKTEAGQIKYLVKWVGNRYPASWLAADHLAHGAHEIYDKEHGVEHSEST
jgi:hypothetical protein